MAGAVVGTLAGNPRHRRKRNPSKFRTRARKAALAARGFLGMPPLMPMVYGGVGFVSAAAITGFVWGTGTTAGMVPADWKTNSDGSENKLTKYAVLAGSLIGTTWIAKMLLGRGPAALAGVGGGIYVISQAVHDFLPDTIPGMSGPLNLAAYKPVYTRQLNGYTSTLRAPNFGAKNTTSSAPAGAANIVAARFRRFQ
jgi:hypothetical protein